MNRQRMPVGRPASTISGLANAATCGILSIRAVCARRVSINGLRRSASSAAGGRRIRIGIRNDLLVAFDGKVAH